MEAEGWGCAHLVIWRQGKTTAVKAQTSEGPKLLHMIRDPMGEFEEHKAFLLLQSRDGELGDMFGLSPNIIVLISPDMLFLLALSMMLVDYSLAVLRK